MKRCTLCGRELSNTKYTFGLGCLKKMCCSINISDVKNLKGEELLNKKILKLCNKKNLPTAQRQILTNRYLTLNLLNEVPLSCYDKYKKLLQKDIDIINSTTTSKNLYSNNAITLKQSSEINKKYKEYKEIFEKVMNGEYDDIQNISFNIVNFAFSKYYNKKPYLSDMTQMLQHYILKCAVLVLKLGNYDISSEFLNHSLQKKPSDIIITEGKVVEKIKENIYFKNKVNEIIKKYGNKEQFNTGKNNESLAFESGDLFLALHNSYINICGNKQNNGNWNLDIELSDIYDFTEFQEIEKYINNDDYAKVFFASFGNNLAMIGTSCKVVNKFAITIKFNIKNWEV